MTTPQISEANILTGETILRDMNAAEVAQYKVDQAQSKANADAKIAQASAKQAVLDRLGITEAEARMLLS